MMNEETRDQDAPSSAMSQGTSPLQEKTQPSPPPPTQASQGSETSGPPLPTEESQTPPPNVAVNTPIPEGMDRPDAGSSTVNRWLSQTFRVTLTQCRERYPQAKTLRQIVSCLETTAGMTPPTQTQAAEAGDDPKEAEGSSDSSPSSDASGGDPVPGAVSEFHEHGEVIPSEHEHDGLPWHVHPVTGSQEGGSQ